MLSAKFSPDHKPDDCPAYDFESYNFVCLDGPWLEETWNCSNLTLFELTWGSRFEVVGLLCPGCEASHETKRFLNFNQIEGFQNWCLEVEFQLRGMINSSSLGKYFWVGEGGLGKQHCTGFNFDPRKIFWLQISTEEWSQHLSESCLGCVQDVNGQWNSRRQLQFCIERIVPLLILQNGP